MKNEPTIIGLAHPSPEDARILAMAENHPVRIDVNREIWRIEREDHYRYFHPETHAETTHDAMQVALSREDFRRMVRAQSRKKNPSRMAWMRGTGETATVTASTTRHWTSTRTHYSDG